MHRKTMLLLCTLAMSLGAQVHADMKSLLFTAPQEAIQNIDSATSIVSGIEHSIKGASQNREEARSELRKLEDVAKSLSDDILFDLDDDVWDDDTEIGDECLGCGPPLTPYPTKAPFQGTNFPTKAPTASPTSCFEEKRGKFFLKFKQGLPVFRRCIWLKKQSKQRIAKSCKKIASCSDGTTDVPPAQEVCKNTCNTCYLIHPSMSPTDQPSKTPTENPTDETTESPSKMETQNPTISLKPSSQPSSVPTAHQSDQPSTAPTVCFEDGHATFYLEPDHSNPHLPVIQQCQWLKTQNNFRSICDENVDSFDNGSISLLPAREVCMNTCDTCYLMHPSEAPSSTPSLHPSVYPSLFSTDCPTEKPSPLPSIRSNPPSAGPSVSPTLHLTSCYEDPDKKFFLRYNKNGGPVFKQCSWLKITNNIEDICKKRTNSCYDGTSLIGPAREVCINTCCTCYLLHPSEVPTTAPSPSPTILYPSCPTC